MPARFARFPAPARAALLVAALATGCSSKAQPGASEVPAPGPTNPAAELPLLGPGQRIGLIYSAPPVTARGAMDAAWQESLARGVDGYELAIRWTDIETAPGVFDLTHLDHLLATTSAAALAPYVVLQVIDTTALTLPADLVDAGFPNELRAGLTFDSPAFSQRLATVLDALVPRLVANGGFYLAIGNEVDVWLAARPHHAPAYAALLAAMRAHSRALDPRLAIGTSVTFTGFERQPALVELLKAASDTVAFTYYPLMSNFHPRSPDVVAADFDTMRAAVAPTPLLLQEVGYPAGWSSGPTNGSSHEAQRRFVQNVFLALRSRPDIRFCSFLHLGDWGPSELDRFESYYGLSDPRFREFLGTLGMREHDDGAAKPSYTEFLVGLDRR
ncbi:MAG: hypothetical protein NXI31_16995 [bacterium]|nr:hypothetical protein [bacterium]